MSFDLIAWYVVAFWICFRVTLVIAKPRIALGVAGGVALASLILPSMTPLMTAVFAPFGFLLPALAIRDVVGRSWIKIAPFHVLEVAAAMIAASLFIAASIGVFTFDPYRLGYGPIIPGTLALAGILWTCYRRHFVITAAILAAQITWSFGFLSPNFFDLVLHALVVPVCAVWLVKWIIAGLLHQFRSAG